MAEQESRTISKNVKWAWQRKFAAGEIILNTGLMLGYKKSEEVDEAGQPIYEIVEEEAAVVRRIFREFISGVSTTRICKGLEEDGIKTPMGKTKWNTKVIRSMLSNEKYTGNAILGKTFKPDVLTKNRMKNDGSQSPMYYVENSHPAIIDKETFDLAQEEMKRRQKVKTSPTGGSKYTSKYPFSGMLVCGICGSRLRRHVRTIGSGAVVPAWGCAARIREGRAVCDSHHVREDVMEQTYIAAVKQITDSADEVIKMVRDGAREAMVPDSAERIKKIEDEIAKVQDEALELHQRKTDNQIGITEYTVKMIVCKDRMAELEKEQEKMKTTAVRYTAVKHWLDSFEENLRTGKILSATDAAVMKSLVDEIIVFDDKIEMHCKCGVTIEQEYVKIETKK